MAWRAVFNTGATNTATCVLRCGGPIAERHLPGQRRSFLPKPGHLARLINEPSKPEWSRNDTEGGPGVPDSEPAQQRQDRERKPETSSRDLGGPRKRHCLTTVQIRHTRHGPKSVPAAPSMRFLRSRYPKATSCIQRQARNSTQTASE